MNNKSTLIFGSLTYATLIILAYIFFKERTMIFDASAQLFTILEADNFVIQVNRFGAIFTQFFPLITSRMDWSMTHVAQVYSMGFVIFYAICFFIILIPLKNPKMALALLFYNILLVSHSFFWIQCEFVQGVAFTLVFLAFVEQQMNWDKVSEVFTMLTPFFVMTIVFFYPLLIFVMSFGLLFLYLYHRKNGFLLCSIFLGYMLIFYIKINFFKTEYDTKSMEGATNIIDLFPNYWNIKSNTNFWQYLKNDYYVFGILFIASLIYYGIQKQFEKLGLLAFYVLGTVFVINVSFQQGADQFYLEPQYTLLALYVGFALSYDVFEHVKINKIAPVCCSLIVILGLFQIIKTSEIYKDRLDWYRNFIIKADKLPGQKLLIDQKNIPLDMLKMTWASCYEFWLLSTVERGYTSSILIDPNPATFDYMTLDKTKFVTKYGNYDYDKLNPTYFIFRDTVSTYKRLVNPL